MIMHKLKFIQKPFPPTLQSFPQLLKLEKSEKKPAFTVSRNIHKLKGVTFENRNKTIFFYQDFRY
jgi:hypothetical protein